MAGLRMAIELAMSEDDLVLRDHPDLAPVTVVRSGLANWAGDSSVRSNRPS
jgi:hypothetical protein